MSEQPTAQYGQIEWTSFAPAMRKFIVIFFASRRSNPSGFANGTIARPAAPAPALSSSRRVRSAIARIPLYSDRSGRQTYEGLPFWMMNAYPSALARRFAEGAGKRGATVIAAELDPAAAEEILQLARVVAHTRERSFAPLASYTAGVAAERLRIAKGADDVAVAAYIREVREALERESPEGARD